MAEGVVLSDALYRRLMRVVSIVERTNYSADNSDLLPRLQSAASGIILEVPVGSGGVPARSGTTVGRLANCQVYSINSSNALVAESGWLETATNLALQIIPEGFYLATLTRQGDWVPTSPFNPCQYVEDWRLNGVDIEVKRCGTWESVHECNEECP